MHLQERLAGIHRDLDALAGLAEREREERLRGLQLAARSLRQAESSLQWVQMLADAAVPLAPAVSFYRVEGNAVRGEAARGMALAPADVPLADAPAFRQAVETKETVVCLFTASQLSAAVTGTEPTRQRAHLFPLLGKTRVLGVLLAMDGPRLEVSGLEVLLSLAAASLELRETKTTTLIGAAPPVPAVAPPSTASAFARTTVANWILEQGDLVSAGRDAANLYGALRLTIDGARRAFSSLFPTGPDYLHAEILERLALGDAALLGPGYPGARGA